MNIMVKTTLKLILRNGLFWVFIILMPILSSLMLKLNVEFTAFSGDSCLITELESADSKAGYYGGSGSCAVKIYDASGSKKSEYLLEKLTESGLFTICRADITEVDVTDDYLNEHIDLDANNDVLGAAIYIPDSFDDMVNSGRYDEALTLYILSDDERVDALEDALKLQLSKLSSAIGTDSFDDFIPDKDRVDVASKEEIALTAEQNNHKMTMGYAFSFLTLGFVFAGFFVANTAIREQKNGVLIRTILTGTDTFKYFTSKFVCAFCTSLLMTVVVFISSFAIDISLVGIDRLTYILLIFSLGLIVSTLSMFVGIVMGGVMGAAVAAFAMWCVSCLFSGMYFPIEHTTDLIKLISYLMPQKWFIKAVEMLYVGDGKAYGVLLCSTVAYLLLIISLGSFGLKMKRVESWGSD